MRISLQRVEPAIDDTDAPLRRKRGERARLLPHMLQRIDVARRAFVRDRKQFLAACAPPVVALRRRRLVRQRAPARPEHRAVFRAQRIGADQQRMQPRNQLVGERFVDHESEIQIVRRLADQMHVERAELGQHRGKPMQQRAHAAPDQRDRRARRDDFDAAHFREIGRERGQHVRVDEVLGRIERHRDVRFRRADQVDRKAVALELAEHVGEEADLLPHADRFHRYERDALARADRLHARRGVRGGGADLGAGELRSVRILDRERHAGTAQRTQRARMQHLRAGRRDFLRFLVIEPREQARLGHLARIRAEHAGHVGPDLDELGLEQRAEVAGRRIRSAAAEHDGFAVGVARDEPLRHEHVAAFGERALQRRIRNRHDRCREIASPRILVRQRIGFEMLARIEPACRQRICADLGKKRSAQRR